MSDKWLTTLWLGLAVLTAGTLNHSCYQIEQTKRRAMEEGLCYQRRSNARRR